MFDLSPRIVPTFYFIGVTTGQSSAKIAWPDWMAIIGRPEVVLEGVDLPLHADPADYRRVVEHIKHDPLSVGALVTTHKIDLLDAARDLFDELGPYARTLNEVSSIAKRKGRSKQAPLVPQPWGKRLASQTQPSQASPRIGGRGGDGQILLGDATDPIASALTLETMLGKDYFGRTGGHVLCLGAGGAASAISLHLMVQSERADRPRRLVVVDLLPSRLEKLRSMVQSQASDIEFEFVHNEDAIANDRLMAALPAGSLVINATGMGKDRPGSPISETAVFPQDGVVWELNYRGALDFYHQALAQQERRNLQVEDGWVYFLHGWSQVIGHVLDFSFEKQAFARFSAAANALRLK